MRDFFCVMALFRFASVLFYLDFDLGRHDDKDTVTLSLETNSNFVLRMQIIVTVSIFHPMGMHSNQNTRGLTSISHHQWRVFRQIRICHRTKKNFDGIGPSHPPLPLTSSDCKKTLPLLHAVMVTPTEPCCPRTRATKTHASPWTTSSPLRTRKPRASHGRITQSTRDMFSSFF